jgi:hypothetical protein
MWGCNQSTFTAAGVHALAQGCSLRTLDIRYTCLLEHAALLGESLSLCDVSLSVPAERRATDWAYANSALLHAPRLVHFVVHGLSSAADAECIVGILRAAWEARSSAVRERRAAAAAAAATAAAPAGAAAASAALTQMSAVGSLTLKLLYGNWKERAERVVQFI